MDKKILVLGTTNSVLSPMMAELIRHLTFKKVSVVSAGLSPKKIHPKVVKVLLEMGIDMSDYQSVSVNEYMHHKFDIIITTTPQARDFVHNLVSSKTKIHKEFDDPRDMKGKDYQIDNAFRRLRDEINEWLNEFLSRHRLI